MLNRCKAAHAILLQNRDVRNQNLLLNFKSLAIVVHMKKKSKP